MQHTQNKSRYRWIGSTRSIVVVARLGIGVLAGVLFAEGHGLSRAETVRPSPSAAAGTPYAALAAFDDVLVDDDVSDSYFVLAIDVDRDGRVDVIKSGLGVPAGSRGSDNPAVDEPGEVAWYENPTWTKHVIARLSVPVGLHHGDVDGDGFEDIVITDNYGQCIFACKPDNGRVSWLRNPGQAVRSSGLWQQHIIGELMATHRVRFGHFTQSDVPEVLAFPVVGGAGGALHERIGVALYRRPEDVLNAKRWPATVVNDRLRVIHGDAVEPFLHTEGSDLQSVLLASEEGLTWLYHGLDRKWQSEKFGAGELREAVGARASWKGSGDVDVGRIGNDRFAYLVSLEPFHGMHVAIYAKNAADSLSRVRWTRYLLDSYGETTPETAEGPGHHVLTGDFDGDGDDEFIVGLRGPYPSSGIFYYKVKDLAKGICHRQRVSSISASRIALADFDGDGRLDFCTAPYVVSTYFRAKDPKVMVYLNRFAPRPERPGALRIKP